MATYLLLNLVFIAAALVAFRIRPRRPSRVWWLTLASVALLTLVFDWLMISLGFFGYADALISGIHIGPIPIEDFFYPIMAAILIPALWGTRRSRE
jgi:lycopene cyclase domain-containing protein